MKRDTSQYLIPAKKRQRDNSSYDINPSHPITEGKIEIGYHSLADRISKEKTVILDGYVGVDWDEVMSVLVSCLEECGLSVSAFDIRNCLKSESEIDVLVEPYLGGDDPVFGRRTTLK